MSFARVFANRLLTAQYSDSVSENKGHILGNYMLKLLSDPTKYVDAVPVWDDPEQARKSLAAWIEESAHAPAMCSPPWGRNFAEQTAVILTNRLDSPFLDYKKAGELAWEKKKAERALRFGKVDTSKANTVDPMALYSEHLNKG